MKIINGDCLDEMKLLPDKSIDLVFADLPYVDSKGKGQTSCQWNQSAIDLDLWWKEIMRIKKLNTPIFMTTTTKFGVLLINSAPKKLKFFDLVWVKSAPTGHLLAKKFPLRKHEMIYVFYEKLPFYDLSSHKHKFIKDKEAEEIPQNKYNHNEEQIYNAEYLEKKVDFKGRDGGSMYEPPLPVSIVKETTFESDSLYGKEGKKIRYKNEEGKITSETNGKRYEPPLPNSMLEIKSTRGKHSTEKPVALMEWILKYYSKEGDVVLDSTMGSGSTGVACKNMNRDFIGIEMDKEIFKVAEERLK